MFGVFQKQPEGLCEERVRESEWQGWKERSSKASGAEPEAPLGPLGSSE